MRNPSRCGQYLASLLVHDSGSSDNAFDGAEAGSGARSIRPSTNAGSQPRVIKAVIPLFRRHPGDETYRDQQTLTRPHT